MTRRMPIRRRLVPAALVLVTALTLSGCPEFLAMLGGESEDTYSEAAAILISITYTGQTEVNVDSQLWVQVAKLDGGFSAERNFNSATAEVTLSQGVVPGEDYVVVAYVDKNQDGIASAGDPVEVCFNRAYTAEQSDWDRVFVGSGLTEINIEFGDQFTMPAGSGVTGGDDFGSDPGSSEYLDLPATKNASVEEPGDIDWFYFWANAGDTVTIETSDRATGNPVDTYLSLYLDGDYSTSIENDNDGNTSNPGYSRIGGYAVPTNSWYYVEVSGTGADQSGDYRLTVSFGGGTGPSDDHGNDATAAQELTLGVAESGVLGESSDEDWFKFYGSFGETYAIGTAAPTGSTDPADTYLTVYEHGSYTAALDFDDNGNTSEPGYSAIASFTPPNTGWYYIVVSGVGLDTTGDYVVGVELDTGGGPNQSPQITVNTDLTQTFMVGQELTVSITATDPDGDDSLIDYLWELNTKPFGSFLNDSDLVGIQTPVARFTPDVAGTYQLVVWCYDGIGAFTAEYIDVTVVENQPPTIDSLAAPPRGKTGSPVDVTATVTDPENGTVSYSWSLSVIPNDSSLISDSITDSGGGIATFIPDVPGRWAVLLSVYDDASQQDSTFVEIEVRDPGTANVDIE